MPVVDRLVYGTTALVAALALVGLFWRKRADACWSYPAFLMSVVVVHALPAALPSVFWKWGFVLAADAVQALLCASVAVEIAVKVFRPLAGGRGRIRRIFTVIAILIVVGVAVFPAGTTAFELTLVVARVWYGLMFLFAAFLLLTKYYYVPVDPVHRDVALGFVLLSVLVAFTHPLSALDPIVGWGRDFVVKFSYLLLLVWWARRAWAAEEPTALTREAMQMLQPWRVKRVQW